MIFKTTLLPYKLKTDYIEDTLVELKKCLESDKFPESGKDCDIVDGVMKK